MKVICTQENLKTGLALVGRIISNTNTLPILNNFLIKTENGQLKISSTNLEVGITTSVRCKVESEGGITVSAKTFTDLINNLPNSNINLESRENSLLVEAENYHTQVKILPVEEFPLIPTVESAETLSISAQDLKKSIDQVSFAASTNQTQPEISGVLLAKEKDGLKIAATDRYRLAEKRLTTQGGMNAEEVIIPQKTINELSRIVGNQKGNVEVLFSPTQIAFNFNETQIISRLVDGQYPAYKEIIPSSFSTTVKINKNNFISALKTTAVFSQSNNSVKVEVLEQKQQVLIAAESSELGKGSVELAAEISGKGISLILNYHYLLNGLSVIDGEEVIIKLIDDSSPGLIVPKDGNDYIYLIMPIKS